MKLSSKVNLFIKCSECVDCGEEKEIENFHVQLRDGRVYVSNVCMRCQYLRGKLKVFHITHHDIQVRSQRNKQSANKNI